MNAHFIHHADVVVTHFTNKKITQEKKIVDTKSYQIFFEKKMEKTLCKICIILCPDQTKHVNILTFLYKQKKKKETKN